ncbi:M24 family metallopeptidase [Notoacmeibacter sp. MSK16QG-6]|uniref:M24 family metallopeptidase n=1 Tax=Notoacmeibacter sp. MSK16QG-6 TaxID=2957982 RepID=UPI0020A04687|nr:M24 family metallopeptidase [Notoacmeibacter sp. MSK16QG-6]MCP1201081.1 hypothetical protein [Notoacmeibacter sp. MSK16QG-6]
MINNGRRVVSDCLAKVILDLLGKPNISERVIKEAWLEEIRSHSSLTDNGWYAPPEKGMAVLASQGDDMRRTHFKSFRDPQFYPSDRPIDWGSSALIAYASNVDIYTGLPADFATTMYFGAEANVKRHFQTCLGCCRELFAELEDICLGRELYLRFEDILATCGIDGRTWSSTDNDYNFGHTLPLLDTESGLSCSSAANASLCVNDGGAEAMRKARLFLSSDSSLHLATGIQFTIEPQCVSQHCPDLPKVMIHYVAQYTQGRFQVCDACDDLMYKFGLN